MEENKSTNSSSDKITWGQYAAYGAGGIIPIALFNVVGILVGLMGNISLGLSAFWLGLILIVPRLWDAVSDPFIGHLSDNTRTKWGRRRPFLLWGGIATAVLFVLIWWIPKSETVEQWFPTESGYQIFQLIYILISLLLFFTAVNLFEIPHGALGMEMTSDSHARTRLFSAKSFVGNLFAMSTPWLFWLANLKIFKGTGTEMDGMRYVSLFIAGLLIPLSIWWFTVLREPKFQMTKAQEKSDFWKDMKMVIHNRNFVLLTIGIFTLAMGFNFVGLLGSYIPIFYIFGGDELLGAEILAINGTVWAVTGMVAVFPLNWISPRLGKRKTLMIAITLMVLAQLSKIVCYNPSYPYLILIPTILLSAGMLFFFTLGSSMVGDICDEDELNTGKRSEGSYYSVFWWFIKLGTALASFVTGALIMFTQFDETQVTKVDKLESNISEIVGYSEQTNKWKLDGKAKEDLHLFDEVKIWLGIDIEPEVLTFEKLEEIKKSNIGEIEGTITVLKKELTKTENEYENIPSYPTQKQAVINKELAILESDLTKLKNVTLSKDSLLMKTKEMFPIITEAKVAKSQVTIADLEGYFDNKIADPNEKNKEHYVELKANAQKMSQQIASLNYSDSKAVEKAFKQQQKDIVLVKKQTPYTLLMMRAVEIGIPVLLSIISMFFIFRYTLTEKRSLEIKELLKQREAQTTA